MFNRISSIGFWLLIISLTVLLGGCNSGSGGPSTLVTVTDQSGNLLPDVTVVLGDSNGVMKNYGTTDANGEITFPDSPANATVTAALSCLPSGAIKTNYSLDVKYDVNASADLRLNACSGSPNSTIALELGTVTVNVTNAIEGITQNAISTNQPLFNYPPSLITQQTITITPFDLQYDGTLSIIVIGKDVNGTSIGYGALLDQTFSNGMTINITVDQLMSFVQYQITSMPTSTIGLCSALSQNRTGKGYIFIDDCHTLSSMSTSTTINMPYIPGLGDQFWYGITVDAGRDSNNGSYIYDRSMSFTGPSGISPSNQSFDLNQALTAPSNLTVNGANTATPTLSWSGVDPGATNIMLVANFPLTSTQYFFLAIYNISHSRTSITFPELPDSLADFRPTGVSFFGIHTSANTGGVSKSSSGYYYYNPYLAAAFNKQTDRQLQSPKMWPRLR